MNRFLTRKKDKGDDIGGKKFKKGKKGQQPEPEPALDLATALPSNDDFRTSLIMPSLSTRFSMLREQDDPTSKLGKASDDSVLQPKRQSRLHEFGFVPGGLSDIAEVSSLNGSIRPPFAAERQDSFDSHNTEDSSGSIMSRARPGEGNVLFGGRQKIYKVSNTGSSKGLGKLLYEDDVHMSAFQRLRLQEKERKEQEPDAQLEQEAETEQQPSSPTKDAYSPSVSGFSQRRETSSSTNSANANARSSTAATSIASQGAGAVAPASSPSVPSNNTPLSPTDSNRTATKGRRLYEQALDQHMYDQQSSAINRLNSIQRARAPTGRSTPPLLFSQARSATNLHDRFNRGAPLNAKDASSTGSNSRPQSPPLVSPLGSDNEDAQVLHSALQPNDRGKATAMGAFNKPKQAFSEQQYAERLKQLQQDRDISIPRLGNPSKPSLRERAELERRKRTENPAAERSVPSSPDQQRKTSLESTTRSESRPTEQRETQIPPPAQPRSPSPIAEKEEIPSPFSVFQAAAERMRNTTTVPTPSPAAHGGSTPHDLLSPNSHQGGTFFASPGSSDDEDEVTKPNLAKPSEPERRGRPHNIPTATGPAPDILDHPALRSRSNSRTEPLQHPALRSRSTSRPPLATTEEETSIPKDTLDSATVSEDKGSDVDSPTLGPNSGGLNVLVRQHLRNLSTISSDYGEDNQIAMSPPALSTTKPMPLQTQNVKPQMRQPGSETNTTTHSSYTGYSNPWDLDELDKYGEEESISSTSPVDSHKPRSTATNAAALITPQAIKETISEWEQEMKRSHRREPSVEEREAFQRELALRQRQVQESLRKQAQNRSRDASPAPGGLKSALNMLRAKSSKESFATVDQKYTDPSHKAMRMLGLGANSANASSSSLAGPYGSDHWRSEDRLGQREPPVRRLLQQSEQDAQRELEQRQRSATNDSAREPMSKGRAPPTSSNSSTRARSSSEVSSGRSHSRPRQYRDDLEQAMVEGAGSKATAYAPNVTPSIPGYVANPTQPLPPEKVSPDSQGRMRSRSNSRAAAASYFESKHLQPIHTSHGATNGASPRLSPAANPGMHQFSPGLPVSPRPSPGFPSPNMNAFRPPASPALPSSANNTPPVSGTSTPVASAFANGAAANLPGTGTLRKKSINKSDISEPIFLSTTSVIDTVNLPPGASLKNGSEVPPPLPPINPMRRRFGFGRTNTDDPAVHSPSPPYSDASYTNSSEAVGNKVPAPRQRLRKTSSEGKSLNGKAQVKTGPSPAVPSMPFGARNGSPPRPNNNQPISQQNMDGAMF
ncbi:uncharacterized protein EI97DRAFT_109105 [Westerdykella ornata]|uniref:Uncharacterized protein n=1 Tax=Westerdykella ornata TaxID=318751 RepID=A0A6A6JW67_WESOR|nr:uncharacterized protein EI97DRAFT_109105 [Westerdykella ornata]KAF2280058.1 hypothetical protein EI97DRAFT_109105 [Westerdykella ornata]